jgi:hypothetical protein
MHKYSRTAVKCLRLNVFGGSMSVEGKTFSIDSSLFEYQLFRFNICNF